jgi:ribosomal protein S21|tara:strand:+ start:205 stop:501 length:297 start_codon:yes stop_codon:yes gene_type:complete
MRHKRRRGPRKISGTLEVSINDPGIKNTDSMVRRFNKKVRKEGIIDEVRERRRFTPNSVKTAERKRAKRRLVEKINRKRDELFNPKGNSYEVRRRRKK